MCIQQNKKEYVPGCIDGWMGEKAVLSTADCSKKLMCVTPLNNFYQNLVGWMAQLVFCVLHNSSTEESFLNKKGSLMVVNVLLHTWK